MIGSLDPQTLQGLPVGFVENRGQWQQYAGDFIAIRDGIRLSLHPGGLGLCLLEVRDGGLAGLGLRMDFENSSPEAHVRGKDQLPGIYNYLKGGDASFWVTEVPAFERLVYEDLYPGISLEVYEHSGGFEYDLLLEPFTDLEPFVVRCDGVTGLRIDPDGSLALETDRGDIHQNAPVAWYENADGSRSLVPCAFRLLPENRYGLYVPGRDPSRRLVIDPVFRFKALQWSTFLGGTLAEDLTVGTVSGGGLITGSSNVVIADFGESAGQITVVGSTFSNDFPVTTGVLDPTFNGSVGTDKDAFITRLNSGGSALIYSTYLGSNCIDEAIAVDLAVKDVGGETDPSNAVVTGYTINPATCAGSFPIT
ncbi:MAG: hypothetical protein RL885_07560 [Planctomycetota bacterium]